MTGELTKSWRAGIVGAQERKSGDFSTLALSQAIQSQAEVSEINALKVSAVLCAVRVIAEGIAQMPLCIRRQEERGGRVYTPDDPKHPAWKVFNLSANSWMTSYQFIEYAVVISALVGNFAAYKVQDNASPRAIKELIPLIPGSWSLEQDPLTLRLRYTITFKDGKSKVVDQDDVFHLRGPSWDTVKGMTPVRLAAKALMLSAALEGHQASLARSGGRPSGVLSVPTPLSPEQRKEIRSDWQERFGADGEGGVAVLDAGGAFIPMTMTSVDAQHIDTRKFQIEEVARWFRVFPQMLMQTDKASTFASAEQFFRAHVTHTLGPWMRRVETTINAQILGAEHPDVYADFDESILLRGDFKDQSTYYSRALGSGGGRAWMTQNDVRRETGLGPIDDPMADKLPLTMNEPQGVAGGRGETEGTEK